MWILRRILHTKYRAILCLQSVWQYRYIKCTHSIGIHVSSPNKFSSRCGSVEESTSEKSDVHVSMNSSVFDVTAGVDIGFDVLWLGVLSTGYLANSCKWSTWSRKWCTKSSKNCCTAYIFCKNLIDFITIFLTRVGTELFRPQGFGNLEKLENAKPCRNFAHLPGECHKKKPTAEQRNCEVIWFIKKRLVENST